MLARLLASSFATPTPNEIFDRRHGEVLAATGSNPVPLVSERMLMRISIIGRADCSGLGYMTRDFCDHVPVDRALIIDRAGRGPTDIESIKAWGGVLAPEIRSQDLDYLLDKCDVLVGFETFYHPDVIPIAVERGVRTVMFPMWECSPPEVVGADFLFCVTREESRRFNYHRGLVRQNWPMESPPTWKAQARQRPLRVVANAGSGGFHDRNNVESMRALLAMSERASNWTMRLNNFDPDRGRWEQYAGADLFVHLQAFDGLSLPLLEAAACGVPSLVLDTPGNASLYPSQCRVHTNGRHEHEMMGQAVPYYRPNMNDLVRAIEQLAGTVRIPPPPRPDTWAEFLEVWNKTLEGK